MRNGLISQNFVVVFLVVITSLDASRIFYLPLPKIHLSNNERNSPEFKPISDELVPLSVMESNMYDEQQVNKNRNNDEWEPLLGKTSKHHISVNERSHENQRTLDYLLALSRETETIPDTKLYDEAETNIDRFSQLKQKNLYSQDWPVDDSVARAARLQSSDDLQDVERSKRRNDALFLVIVGVCTLVGILGLVAAAIFWYKIQRKAESALDSEYPSYGVTGPGSNGTKLAPNSTISDRKLAQSAQMFHYQQQRQQMMAQEKAHLDTKPVQSDDSDDEAPNGGDYTVYECPGLAPTGEMEVRNPLFTESDSSTLAPHPATNNHYPQPTTSTPSSSPPKEKSLP